MNIFNRLFYRREIKLIEELGFNKPSSEIFLFQIEDSTAGYRPNGHFVVLKKDFAIKLSESFSCPDKKQRIIHKAFCDWIIKPSTLEIAEITPLLRIKARWLFLALNRNRNIIGIDTSFQFLCSNCNVIYKYEPLNAGNNSAENNAIYETLREGRGYIYNAIYCPKKHLIFKSLKVRFNLY
jgi:hypothetical protein